MDPWERALDETEKAMQAGYETFCRERGTGNFQSVGYAAGWYGALAWVRSVSQADRTQREAEEAADGTEAEA